MQRTQYDIEMLKELGFTSGIENYSRILDGRPPGSPPHTLIDYFPDDFVVFVDESHQTIPQIGGMYEGDRSRKQTLVDYGFRLPSAIDNRPLKFDEFLTRVGQLVMVSATPGEFERGTSARIVEQIVRPTGIVDPEVEVRETRNQIDDLMNEIRRRVEVAERTLVTTLTKKMAEDLTGYLLEHGLRVRYLHSEVDTLERIQIIRDLRLGEYDVLVGVNLLREGLDLPEVSLVAILDADKEGFLRGETSLIQTIGRAARNVRGRVLMYADRETEAMRKAISETDRRREIQLAYNREHGITPGDGPEGDLRHRRVPLDGVAGGARPAPPAARRRRRADDPRAAREGRRRARGGDARRRRGPALRGGGRGSATSSRSCAATSRRCAPDAIPSSDGRFGADRMAASRSPSEVAEQVRSVAEPSSERRRSSPTPSAEAKRDPRPRRGRGAGSASTRCAQALEQLAGQARRRPRPAHGGRGRARARSSCPSPSRPPCPSPRRRPSPRRSRPSRAAVDPGADAAARRGHAAARPANGAARSDDAAGARLVAMNMALEGASREQIADRLGEDFELDDAGRARRRGARACRQVGGRRRPVSVVGLALPDRERRALRVGEDRDPALRHLHPEELPGAEPGVAFSAVWSRLSTAK